MQTGDKNERKTLAAVNECAMRKDGGDQNEDNLQKTLCQDDEHFPRWDEFFDRHFYVTVSESSDESSASIASECHRPCAAQFSVYEAGAAKDESIPGLITVLLHGAGHTALSWALVARELKPEVHLFAFDQRGHGLTQCADGSSLTAQRLTNDAIAVVNRIVADYRNRHPSGADPRVVLVGHSMGAAVAAKVAAAEAGVAVVGLVMLDAVEGTALAALPQMKMFLQRFPKSFATPRDAVDWSLKSGILSNRDSAVISIPSQLRKDADQRWVWRIDLAATEPFWRDWFLGSSNSFLKARCPKALVLAGHDRLDKTLMIAEMQGKFQQVILTKSGHILEEDQPGPTARVLLQFITRNKLQ